MLGAQDRPLEISVRVGHTRGIGALSPPDKMAQCRPSQHEMHCLTTSQVSMDLIKGPRASKKWFDSLKTARTSPQEFLGFLDRQVDWLENQIEIDAQLYLATWYPGMFFSKGMT